MAEPTLPAVTYADYKRAIRGSKRKSDASQRESIKEEVSSAVKSTSQNMNDNRKSNHTVRNSEGVKASKNSSSLLPSSTVTSRTEGTVSRSAQIEEKISQQNLNENAQNNNAEDEGFEVFASCAEASDDLETSLSIQHTQSNESGTPFVSNEQQNDTNVQDSTLQQKQESSGDKEEHMPLTESTSFKSSDDSIFSIEGAPEKKGSPPRVVIPAPASSDAPRLSQSRVGSTTTAIDMTGCIRRSVSPDSSKASSTRSNNIRQLQFSQSPNLKRSRSHEREEVSSEPKHKDQRWQEFGSSLSLLGAPVLSWFSATTSEGVVANDDDALSPQPSKKDKRQTTHVDDAKTRTSTSSSSAAASKKKNAVSSVSSTDDGSLSTRDIAVGEVAPNNAPRVEISFPRQLSWFFSNNNNSGQHNSKRNNSNQDSFSMNDWSQRTWNKVATCIPSKDDNPKGWYLFIFGIYVISAIIFAMIMSLAFASDGESALVSGNSSAIEALLPSPAPTIVASSPPSDGPSLVPSNMPTNSPTITGRPTSSQVPSTVPSESPSHTPSIEPSGNPTVTAVPTSEPITYVPGKLIVKSNGLKLSEGLNSRIVARSGQKVVLDGLKLSTAQLEERNTSSSTPTSAPTAWLMESDEVFHFKPDGAAAYAWPENDDHGGKGWIYVSNAEVWDKGDGGVGALYFDDQGRVVDYKTLINGTTANCSGGKTPWHTWVTCEEDDDGRIYQIDPLGIRPPEEMTIGMGRGKWESFAYDIRDQSKPRYFATEDKDTGTLRRFTPDEPDWDDPWTMLQANGTVDFLVLEPSDWDTRRNGTFFWTDDLRAAKDNARRLFQHSEGIDVRGNQLFVVSKVQKELFILDLDTMTYEVHSTVFGMFDGQPDQMKRLISDDDKVGTKHDKSLLYFCEEGGRHNGVHARDSNGWYFTILESDVLDGETSGLAFSPDGKHMYFSYQHRGIIFDVWREDGRPFHGKTLSVKYHETGQARSRELIHYS